MTADLDPVECKLCQRVTTLRACRRRLRPAGCAFERLRRVFQFLRRLGQVDFAEREDRVPKWENPPLTIAVTHRAKVRDTFTQPLFSSIQASREQVTPEPDGAFAAAETAGVGVARVERRSLQTPHQTVACAF
jgi:hypothetical protein